MCAIHKNYNENTDKRIPNTPVCICDYNQHIIVNPGQRKGYIPRLFALISSQQLKSPFESQTLIHLPALLKSKKHKLTEIYPRSHAYIQMVFSSSNSQWVKGDTEADCTPHTLHQKEATVWLLQNDDRVALEVSRLSGVTAPNSAHQIRLCETRWNEA